VYQLKVNLSTLRTQQGFIHIRINEARHVRVVRFTLCKAGLNAVAKEPLAVADDCPGAGLYVCMYVHT
jgi:hypothetical protein